MRVDRDETDLRAENARLREALAAAERELSALARLDRAGLPRDRPEPLLAAAVLGLELADLRERKDFVEAILQSSSDCIDVLDVEARLVFMSEGGARVMEIDDVAAVIGFDWLAFWEGDDRVRAQAAVEAAKSGAAGRFVGACPTARGTPKVWDVVITPMRDGDGRVAQLLAVSRDVTREQAAEDALRESETRLRLAQAAGGFGVFEADLQTGAMLLSPEAAGIVGLPAEAVSEIADVEALVLAEDRDRFLSLGQRVQGGARVSEFRLRRPDDGRVVQIARHADLSQGPDGGLTRFVGVVQDVTERKEAQAQQRLLMQELAHRVKNTLAIIKSIANQTLRDLADRDEVQAFDARLLALSRAFDVLLQESWTAARIVSLIEGAVGAHGGGRRFRLAGPNILIGPKSALSLVLLMHELCTNAVKYGALSNREGRVAVNWRIEPGDGGPDLILTWVETDGPTVTPPSRTGFGSRIMKLGLAGARRADLAYRSEGLTATFRAAVAALEG